MRKVGWEGLRLICNSSLGVSVSVPTVQEPAGHLEMGYKNEHKTQGSSPTLLVNGRACSEARGEAAPFSSPLHRRLTFCLLTWRWLESSPCSGCAAQKTELPLGNWPAGWRLLKGKRKGASPMSGSISHRVAHVRPCPTSHCSRNMSWAFVPLCLCSYYIPGPKG